MNERQGIPNKASHPPAPATDDDDLSEALDVLSDIFCKVIILGVLAILISVVALGIVIVVAL